MAEQTGYHSTPHRRRRRREAVAFIHRYLPNN